MPQDTLDIDTADMTWDVIESTLNELKESHSDMRDLIYALTDTKTIDSLIDEYLELSTIKARQQLMINKLINENTITKSRYDYLNDMIKMKHQKAINDSSLNNLTEYLKT